MRSKELLGTHEPPAHPGRVAASRSLSIWDSVGITALFSAGAIVSGLVGLRLARGDPGYGREMFAVLSIGLIGAAVAVWLGARAANRERLPLRRLPGSLVLPWVHPARDGVMFLFGFLVSIPLLTLVAVLSLQALCGVVSYIAWKLTRSAAGAVAAVLALLSFRSIPERATLLPMYAAMLALGFLGVYFSWEATRFEGRRRWLFAVLSGLSLYLSTEAHALGLVFLAVPLFLVVTMPIRKVVHGLSMVYLALAAFYLPRALLNLADGGLSHFLTYRDDYWVSKGYVSLIQKDFWILPTSSFSISRYVADLPRRIPALAGKPGLVPLVVAVVAFPLARGRLRWFAVLCLGYFMAPLVLRRAPFYPRYYTPLAVGAAMCAGAGVSLLATRRGAFLKLLAAASVALLLLTASFNGAATLRATRSQQMAILRGPFRALAARIDDGKGVIGARSTYLLFASTHVRTFGGQFLSERDYVTYLTWPSDQAVIGVLRKNDIGWVVVNPKRRLETTYHDTWLVPTYGKRARHLEALRFSPSFCPVFEEAGYILYRLGPCK